MIIDMIWSKDTWEGGREGEEIRRYLHSLATFKQNVGSCLEMKHASIMTSFTYGSYGSL